MKQMIIGGLCLLLLAGCTGTASQTQETGTYTSIDQQTAMARLSEETGYILLDVRTQEEYDTGHLPGAVCIPVETIGEDITEQLPDKEQTVFVYCRSGNRSKQAAAKLAEMGYRNIYEIGGINTWPGEIVTD